MTQFEAADFLLFVVAVPAALMYLGLMLFTRGAESQNDPRDPDDLDQIVVNK